MEATTHQIYCYFPSICRQNSLKAKRLSILISPHGSMYLVECFREGFKDYTPNTEIRILKNSPICERFCLRA